MTRLTLADKSPGRWADTSEMRWEERDRAVKSGLVTLLWLDGYMQFTTVPKAPSYISAFDAREVQKNNDELTKMSIEEMFSAVSRVTFTRVEFHRTELVDSGGRLIYIQLGTPR